VRTHQFAAVAFEENLSLRDLAPLYPGAKVGVREIRFPTGNGGEVFIYPFGAMVFHDVDAARRETELRRLREARPGLTTQVVRESFTVREEPGAKVDIVDGTLVVDEFGPGRSAVVALIVAQSAALEQRLRGSQEALELVLDVARDRRMWLLEFAIVMLIVLELLLALLRRL